MVWREQNLLLMRRSDNGYWGLPGGFVELGESVTEATRREVFEETGWEVAVGALIGVYSVLLLLSCTRAIFLRCE